MRGFVRKDIVLTDFLHVYPLPFFRGSRGGQRYQGVKKKKFAPLELVQWECIEPGKNPKGGNKSLPVNPCYEVDTQVFFPCGALTSFFSEGRLCTHGATVWTFYPVCPSVPQCALFFNSMWQLSTRYFLQNRTFLESLLSELESNNDLVGLWPTLPWSPITKTSNNWKLLSKKILPPQ